MTSKISIKPKKSPEESHAEVIVRMFPSDAAILQEMYLVGKF